VKNRSLFFYTRQKDRKGLGDAILHAENFVDGCPFIARVGDTILVPGDDMNPLNELMEIYEQYEKPVMLFDRVRKEDVEKYGIIAGEKINDKLYKKIHLLKNQKKRMHHQIWQ